MVSKKTNKNATFLLVYRSRKLRDNNLKDEELPSNSIKIVQPLYDKGKRRGFELDEVSIG